MQLAKALREKDVLKGLSHPNVVQFFGYAMDASFIYIALEPFVCRLVPGTKAESMNKFDLVIRNGTVITASEKIRCDVAVHGGKIIELGDGVDPGVIEIDATDRLGGDLAILDECTEDVSLA